MRNDTTWRDVVLNVRQAEELQLKRSRIGLIKEEWRADIKTTEWRHGEVGQPSRHAAQQRRQELSASSLSRLRLEHSKMSYVMKYIS
eukprot:4203236-Pleurochrysis_carterae.AAC.1